MRVLVVSQARYGVHNVIDALLRELAGHDDVDATYLTIPTHDAPAGIDQVSLLSESRLQRYEGNQLRYLAYAVLNFWRCAYRWLAANHAAYDVVWFHNPRLLPLLPDELDRKLLVTYHNHLLSNVTRHYDRPQRWYYRAFGAFERRGIQRAPQARYTVVNPAVVAELTDVGVAPDHVRYVENGVDTGRFHPEADDGSRETYDLPSDVPLVLSLGRLTGQKRPDLLVDWFADLSEALSGEVALAIAGKGPREEAARQVASERSAENVHFLGYVPEAGKATLYAAADHFVMASSYEGSPLVLYEALASGTPAIVPDLPGTRFVADAECGIVTAFDDDRDVARIAGYITEDDDRSENARTYAVTHLDWAERVAEYRTEFERIVNNE